MIRALILALTLAVPVCAAAEPATRIVSLGGSVTEIAVALGAGGRLIGRDSTSQYPEEVLGLPDVGYIRALSPEGVLSLGPDLVISETGAGPAEAVGVLKSAGVPFVEMPAEPSAAGVLAKIDAVAAALDLPEAGARLHESVARDLAAVEAMAGAVERKKTVLFIITLQSDRVVAGGDGSTAEGIVRLAGGINAATGFEGFKQISDEAILTMAPDLIVVMAHGVDRPGRVEEVLSHPALGQTPAAKAGRVLHVDGGLTLGFGPRTAEAARLIHDALYGS